MELSEIKNKIDREEWILPPFQREYVWDEEKKIIDFIESVFSKWPVGSIILWTPNPKDPDIIKMQKRKLQTASSGKPWYPQEFVLDGQQRLTTLLRILNNETFRFRGKDKKMCFDFSSQKFLFTEEDNISQNIVLLNDILGLSHSDVKRKLNLGEIDKRRIIIGGMDNTLAYTEKEILEIVEKGGAEISEKNLRALLISLINDKKLRAAQRPKDNEWYFLKTTPFLLDIDDLIDKIKKIKEYPMDIQRTPAGTSLKDAQELFIRLNTGGKPLPSVDLALSYISLLWDDSRETFKQFEEEIVKKGYNFDLDFFVRCLSAVSLEQSLTKKLIKSFDAETIHDDWKKTAAGIEKTIDFIKTTLSLNSNLFLEAENTLVPIVLMFAKKDVKLHDKMDALAYWFIVSYMNQRFSGQSTDVLNGDINAILKSENPVESLIKNLMEDRKVIFDVEPKNIEGRQFKFILYALYKEIKTRDFVSGFGIDSLTASPSNRLDFHHIFADSILKTSAFKERKEDIANKTFLTNKSNKELSNSDPTYLSDYPKNLLEAHLIPTDEKLWNMSRYEDFLTERKKLISSKLNEFLLKLNGKH